MDMRSPIPGMLEQRRFSEHIMQGYNKPKRREVPGYGAPRTCVLQAPVKDTSDVVDLVVRPPSRYNIMPKRQKAVRCDRPGMVSCEFCDVLGPLSCHECIESTNRRIAHEVEHAAFPDMDCTASSLVAPTLAQLMVKSTPRGARNRRGVQQPPRHARVSTIIEPALGATTAGKASLLPPIKHSSGSPRHSPTGYGRARHEYRSGGRHKPGQLPTLSKSKDTMYGRAVKRDGTGWLQTSSS